MPEAELLPPDPQVSGVHQVVALGVELGDKDTLIAIVVGLVGVPGGEIRGVGVARNVGAAVFIHRDAVAILLAFPFARTPSAPPR